MDVLICVQTVPEYIDLSSNMLSGSIPPSLGEIQLMNLHTFFLHENDLTGTMPDSVCDLPLLEDLTTDCGGGSPENVCGCCSVCFTQEILSCPDRNASMLARLSELTEEELLLDPSTPQGAAYKWFLEVDLNTDPCNDANVEQRYGLAVLYYSTQAQGQYWASNWLSSTSECTWSEDISCNSASFVTRLYLGMI